MPSDYIVLRGAPGTGKTTTARLLMRLADRGATVEVDDIRRMINGVIWESHQQHFDAIRAAAAAAKAYRECGYQPIVFVDTLAFGSLDLALEALDSSSVSVYSLVCSHLLLTLRLWRRLRGFRDAAKSVRIDAHVRTDGSHSCKILDTTSTGARRIARLIMEREGF